MISIGLILYHLLLCSCCAHVVRSMNTIGAGRKHHWCSWLIVLITFCCEGGDALLEKKHKTKYKR